MDEFDTVLSPEEELSFRAWKAKFAPNDSGRDYDLRGAFKAGLSPDPSTGHWSDRFKKPNHPTFSTESQYAKFGNPGRWGGKDGETFVMPAGREEEYLDPMSPFYNPKRALLSGRRMNEINDAILPNIAKPPRILGVPRRVPHPNKFLDEKEKKKKKANNASAY